MKVVVRQGDLSQRESGIEVFVPHWARSQRGTDHQAVFFTAADRTTYLSLIARHQADAGVRVLAYGLMTNHLHFIVVPERADSLAVFFRRVHGTYSQWINTRRNRSGHFWQNRFYSCPMSERHLWIGLRYVENNPVRARMTATPTEYRWSSATVHLQGVADRSGVLDLDFFQRSGGVETWREMYAAQEDPTQAYLLRRCSYGGRPFGDESFVQRIEERFGRKWRRWTFEKALDDRMLA